MEWAGSSIAPLPSGDRRRARRPHLSRGQRRHFRRRQAEHRGARRERRRQPRRRPRARSLATWRASDRVAGTGLSGSRPIRRQPLDIREHGRTATDLLLTRTWLEWFRGLYLTRPDQGAGPRASPTRTDNLAGLAPAVIVTTEHDPLRDQGDRYAHNSPTPTYRSNTSRSRAPPAPSSPSPDRYSSHGTF